MSNLILNKTAAPSTPTANKAGIYIDQQTAPTLRFKNEAGADTVIAPICNQSTAGQTPAATTRTYITGSNLPVPTIKLQVGACFEWIMAITKTAAGTATSTFDICVGTAGTTADTARVSFTKPVGTAAADEGVFTIRAVVKVAGASGVLVGEFLLMHNGNTVGHATAPIVALTTTSSAFDMTVANLIVGVCITSGASDALTISMVQARAWNL